MKLAQFWYFGHVSKSLVAKYTTAMNLNPDLFAQPTDLVHGVGEERLEGAPLASRLLLESVEEVGELGVLLALREDLSESEHERG